MMDCLAFRCWMPTMDNTSLLGVYNLHKAYGDLGHSNGTKYNAYVYAEISCSQIATRSTQASIVPEIIDGLWEFRCLLLGASLLLVLCPSSAERVWFPLLTYITAGRGEKKREKAVVVKVSSSPLLQFSFCRQQERDLTSLLKIIQNLISQETDWATKIQIVWLWGTISFSCWKYFIVR